MTLSIKIVCHCAECRVLLIIMPNLIVLNVITLSVVMLSVVMLSVVMLNVVMLSVVMVSVEVLFVVFFLPLRLDVFEPLTSTLWL